MLTDREREQIKIKHKQERDGRVQGRIKAVLLTDKGWSSEAIAEALLISDQAVRNHIRDYRATGKLKPESPIERLWRWLKSQYLFEHPKNSYR